MLIDFSPSSGEGTVEGWEQDLRPPLAGAGEWWAVSLSDPVGPGRMGQELPLVMLRPPCCSWPRFIHSTLSDLAASLEALICSDRFHLTLGVLRQMRGLLLTTERAPVVFLSRLLSSWREPRRPLQWADLCSPWSGNALRIPLLVLLIKLRTFPSVFNFTNGFGVLTDPFSVFAHKIIYVFSFNSLVV